MSAANQLCTFYLDKLYFGVEVLRVQEVIRFQKMTRVPLAPPTVRGLINLRGQIVTAIDMRRRLGLPPLPENQLPMNVVIAADNGPISLLVDHIGDVVDVYPDDFEEPPETLDRHVRKMIRGTYKLPNQLLLTLDCSEAVRLTTNDTL